MCVYITSSGFRNCELKGVMRISGAGRKGICDVEALMVVANLWLYTKCPKIYFG